MSEHPQRQKHRVGGDLIIPVAASLYAIYYVASVWTFPPEAQRSGMFLAGLLLFFSSLYFLRVIVATTRHGARMDFDSVLGSKEGRKERLAFFALILAYLPFVRWGGFTLTTFLFLLIGSWLAGLRPVRKAIVFAAAASLAGWLFFIVLLGTRFPRGPFEHLVSELVRLWN
jgi:hypothetical protein